MYSNTVVKGKLGCSAHAGAENGSDAIDDEDANCSILYDANTTVQ